MRPKFFIDSTIVVIATEQIGEAWSTVILDEVAQGRLKAWTNALALAEILDSYAVQDRRYEGRALFRAWKKLMGGAVEAVSVTDFDEAFSSWQERPAGGAREHLHGANIRGQGLTDILAIDGPGYEDIQGLKRVGMKLLLNELSLEGEYIEQRS